ncbi:crotonase/enoyl-CoA hydratase family protein [Parahaliea maris]|uniref:Crotonase/enoyl-CoA hydratase family protein n=1 Tax=Parahaliea maris TaxID=2716870 RepID=A0A5C9A7T9_9GAMM|nr:crotonase/enoyl-CoA hydratase family protein [Parahaliea maris]TXS95291.1 crotonase/enoyl-CoA hydratase family protein [Parahaliea maris]
MSDLIQFTENNSHSLIVMDDGKANALSFAMFEALNAALDRAEQAGKAVVLAGRAGKFSAGFDLSVMVNMDEGTIKLLREGAELSRRLLTFPLPVVLTVSGHALAMGALLCLSADYRIGAQGGFKIGLNEVAIGMTLPWFGIELARGRLTTTHFDSAVGLARIYDPESAVTAGYLDEVVAAEDLLSRATELADSLAGLNLEAHCKTKARTREDLLARFETALERDFERGEAMG